MNIHLRIQQAALSSSEIYVFLHQSARYSIDVIIYSLTKFTCILFIVVFHGLCRLSWVYHGCCAVYGVMS